MHKNRVPGVGLAHSKGVLPMLDLRPPTRYKARKVPGAGSLTVNGMMRLELPVGDGARVDVPSVIRRERFGPRVG
jgi:hypothetical protein